MPHGITLTLREIKPAYFVTPSREYQGFEGYCGRNTCRAARRNAARKAKRETQASKRLWQHEGQGLKFNALVYTKH
jgi:hypothetical protein